MIQLQSYTRRIQRPLSLCVTLHDARLRSYHRRICSLFRWSAVHPTRQNVDFKHIFSPTTGSVTFWLVKEQWWRPEPWAISVIPHMTTFKCASVSVSRRWQAALMTALQEAPKDTLSCKSSMATKQTDRIAESSDRIVIRRLCHCRVVG